MQPISEDAAKSHLSELHGQLRETVLDAWKTLISEVLPLFPLPTTRFKRNAMYELMIQKARTVFFESDKARLTENKQGRILLTVQSPTSHIILRFKKVNRKLETSNFPTQGSLAYDNQQPNLPHIPGGVRLTLGYLMDQAETVLEKICIICTTGKRLHWQYHIWQAGEDAPAVLVPIKSSGSILPKRVRAKRNVTDLKIAREKKNRRE